jgi:hypothetical protein
MHVVYAYLNGGSKIIDEEIKQFKKSNLKIPNLSSKIKLLRILKREMLENCYDWILACTMRFKPRSENI